MSIGEIQNGNQAYCRITGRRDICRSGMLGDELSEALRSGDRKQIDAKLGEVIGNCAACHHIYSIY